jgi:excisionase family DNA binding protein
MARGVPAQLELEVVPIQSTQRRSPDGKRGRSSSATPRARLALSPDEAAAALGVSRDYFDEHILGELRVVRRGRRILIPLVELERWLDRAATVRASIDRANGRG